MKISQLARSIPQSSTLRLNEEARRLRERGEPVIHLGIGEPKNKAPFAAILSAASKLTSGDLKYMPTDGLPSLKKAILRYMEEDYDKLASPENVIVTAGAKQSINGHLGCGRGNCRACAGPWLWPGSRVRIGRCPG